MLSRSNTSMWTILHKRICPWLRKSLQIYSLLASFALLQLSLSHSLLPLQRKIYKTVKTSVSLESWHLAIVSLTQHDGRRDVVLVLFIESFSLPPAKLCGFSQLSRSHKIMVKRIIHLMIYSRMDHSPSCRAFTAHL